ncbi:hypothetical protein Gotur_010763 [Gossypium turneri]
MGRRPQMVMAFNLQPSLEYIQWYYSCRNPYIIGGQSIVVPHTCNDLGDRTQQPRWRRSLQQIIIPSQSRSRCPSQIPSSHIHMGIYIAIIRI